MFSANLASCTNYKIYSSRSACLETFLPALALPSLEERRPREETAGDERRQECSSMAFSSVRLAPYSFTFPYRRLSALSISSER
jgi:hypothetical protein